MASSYSQELRDRMIVGVEKEEEPPRGGGSVRVSELSAIKWVRRRRLSSLRAPAGTAPLASLRRQGRIWQFVVAQQPSAKGLAL
jgi:hypothetical protein